MRRRHKPRYVRRFQKSIAVSLTIALLAYAVWGGAAFVNIVLAASK